MLWLLNWSCVQRDGIAVCDGAIIVGVAALKSALAGPAVVLNLAEEFPELPLAALVDHQSEIDLISERSIASLPINT